MLRVFATLKLFLGDGTRRKLSLVFLTIFSLGLLVITAVSLIVAINQKNTLNNVKRETPFQAAAQLQIQTFKLIQTLETSNMAESERAQEISMIIDRLSNQIERQRITILRANLDASSSSTRIIEEMTHSFFSLKSDISRRGTLSPETRQRASQELKVLLPDFVFFLQEAKSLEDRIERDLSELILRFIWWHLSLAILTFVSGSILAIYLFRSAYITRAALHEANETRQVAGEAHGRLLDALENMPEGFALFDRERRLVLCNDNYRRLYTPNGDLLAPGARLDDILFLAAERGQFPQALGNIGRWVGEEIARLGSFAGPIVQHLPDDRWTKIEDRRTTSGGVVSICTDITELKQRENELLRSQDSLAEAQHLANLGSWRWDAVTDRMEWSDEMYRIFELVPRTDTLGLQAIIGAIHPDDREAVRSAMTQARAAGQHYEQEYRVLGLNGSERSVTAKGRPVRDAEGRVTGMIGTVQDMTDRRRVEHELRVAKQTAEQASRAKTAFLAMMSHEIRTPLNGVLGTLGLLKDTRLDPDQHSLLETALESSEALLTILNDILDFSKMEAGRLDLEPAPFDPWALVSSVFDLTEPLARHKGLTLVKTLAGSLPPALVGDANRIRQILLNLVSNGIKFTESGHILITGSSSIDEDGRRRLRFEIEDTGIGIPRDKQSELFIDFNQLDRSYARKFGGTGLGLAIVRRLVETMNGRMGFMSAPGIGSNFWFEIPLEPATMPAEIREDIIESSAPATGQQRLRILVAEDNRTNQLIIKRLLEKQGHHVDVVGNGLEAVAAVGNVPYDCVLMDIAMPEMDGIEATRGIRSLSEPIRSIRIIALTANVMAEDFSAYAAAGMDACIAKPLRIDELNSLLAYMCAPVDPVAVPPSTPADEESTPIIDSEMLGSLQESLEGTTLDEVLNIFVLDIQDRAARIGQAGINGDTKTIRFEVHAMASSARALGAMRLWQHARQVEELCDQGKADEAFALVQTIETIARETSDAVSRWMAA